LLPDLFAEFVKHADTSIDNQLENTNGRRE